MLGKTSKSDLYSKISLFIQKTYIDPDSIRTSSQKSNYEPVQAGDADDCCAKFSMADDCGTQFSLAAEDYWDIVSAMSPFDSRSKTSLSWDVQDVLSRYSVNPSSLGGYLKTKMVTTSFADKMQHIMASKHLLPVMLYKKARIDRRVFSKICGREVYNPSKDTCISLILALDVDIETADELLSLAGYSLSNNSKRDLVIHYCIENGPRSVDGVNDMLNMFHFKILCA